MIATRILVTIVAALSVAWVSMVTYGLISLEYAMFGHLSSTWLAAVLAAGWVAGTVWLWRRSWTATNVGRAWLWAVPWTASPLFSTLWWCVAFFFSG